MTKSTPKPQSFPFTVLAAVIIVGGSIGYFGAQKFGSRYFFGLGAAPRHYWSGDPIIHKQDTGNKEEAATLENTLSKSLHL